MINNAFETVAGVNMHGKIQIISTIYIYIYTSY